MPVTIETIVIQIKITVYTPHVESRVQYFLLCSVINFPKQVSGRQIMENNTCAPFNEGRGAAPAYNGCGIASTSPGLPNSWKSALKNRRCLSVWMLQLP